MTLWLLRDNFTRASCDPMILFLQNKKDYWYLNSNIFFYGSNWSQKYLIYHHNIPILCSLLTKVDIMTEWLFHFTDLYRSLQEKMIIYTFYKQIINNMSFLLLHFYFLVQIKIWTKSGSGHITFLKIWTKSGSRQIYLTWRFCSSIIIINELKKTKENRSN